KLWVSAREMKSSNHLLSIGLYFYIIFLVENTVAVRFQSIIRGKSAQQSHDFIFRSSSKYPMATGSGCLIQQGGQ
ncbi:MAG: hypothetical protein ABI476_10345, partial [Oxalobacteraceae bacterium]